MPRPHPPEFRQRAVELARLREMPARHRADPVVAEELVPIDARRRGQVLQNASDFHAVLLVIAGHDLRLAVASNRLPLGRSWAFAIVARTAGASAAPPSPA